MKYVISYTSGKTPPSHSKMNGRLIFNKWSRVEARRWSDSQETYSLKMARLIRMRWDHRFSFFTSKIYNINE